MTYTYDIHVRTIHVDDYGHRDATGVLRAPKYDGESPYPYPIFSQINWPIPDDDTAPLVGDIVRVTFQHMDVHP